MKYALLFLILLVSVFPLSGVAYAQSEELPDPGVLPDSPLYFLKSLWESIVSFFTFGDTAKAERALELSEKRLAEARALITKGDSDTAGEALTRYREQFNKAVTRARAANEKGTDTDELFVSISEAVLNHQSVLLAARKQMPEESAPVIEGALQAGVEGWEEALQSVPLEKKKELIEKSGKFSAEQIAGILGRFNQSENGQPVSTPGSNCEDCESSAREYKCPYLVEYEFDLSIQDNNRIAYFISSGPPVLKLEDAEIEGDRLTCHYCDTFITADVSAVDDEIVLMLENSGETCPTFLKLKIKDKDSVAPDWKKVQPGYVKIDKNHSGHRYVVYALSSSDNEKALTYDGCVYNLVLKNDENFQSNPDLWMEVDGVCIVNDTNDGFICADSLAELYGKGDMQPSENMQAP